MARPRRSGGEARTGGETEAAAVGTTGQEAAPARAASFEDALAALEVVVHRLESGDMPLEQALEAFEQGVKLSRQCAATLDAAERRIEILVAERGGAVRLEPFHDERSDDEETDGLVADDDEAEE